MTDNKLSETALAFDQLPFVEQAAQIWQRGQPLATRYVGDFRLHLYVLDNFFVEMWVCRRRYVVTLFRPLVAVDGLLPYVEGKHYLRLLAGLNVEKSSFGR